MAAQIISVNKGDAVRSHLVRRPCLNFLIGALPSISRLEHIVRPRRGLYPPPETEISDIGCTKRHTAQERNSQQVSSWKCDIPKSACAVECPKGELHPRSADSRRQTLPLTVMTFRGKIPRTFRCRPAILLDYIYGAAAYNLWKSKPDSVHEGIQACYEGNIQVLPQESSKRSASDVPGSKKGDSRVIGFTPHGGEVSAVRLYGKGRPTCWTG